MTAYGALLYTQDLYGGGASSTYGAATFGVSFYTSAGVTSLSVTDTALSVSMTLKMKASRSSLNTTALTLSDTATLAKGRVTSDTALSTSSAITLNVWLHKVTADTGVTLTDALVRAGRINATLTDTGTTVSSSLIGLGSKPLTDRAVLISDTFKVALGRNKTDQGLMFSEAITNPALPNIISLIPPTRTSSVLFSSLSIDFAAHDGSLTH